MEAVVEGESSLSGHFYVERLLPEELEECIRTLDAGSEVQQAQPTKLSGTLNAREDGTAVFALPYDAGWQLTVDGQAVETASVGSREDGGALLAAEITAGTHTFTLRYRAPGLLPGVLISVASLALLALWTLWVYGSRRHTKTANSACDIPPAAEQQPETPAIRAPGDPAEAKTPLPPEDATT